MRLVLVFFLVLSSCVQPDPDGWTRAQAALDARDYDAYVAHLRSGAKAGDVQAMSDLAPILKTGHVLDPRVDYVAHVIAPDLDEAASLQQRVDQAYRDSLFLDPHHERANLRFAGQFVAEEAMRPKALAYYDAAIAGGSVRAMGMRGQLEYFFGPDSARGVRYLERAIAEGEAMPWAVYVVSAYQNEQTATDSARADHYIALLEAEGVEDATAFRF